MADILVWQVNVKHTHTHSDINECMHLSVQNLKLLTDFEIIFGSAVIHYKLPGNSILICIEYLAVSIAKLNYLGFPHTNWLWHNELGLILVKYFYYMKTNSIQQIVLDNGILAQYIQITITTYTAQNCVTVFTKIHHGTLPWAAEFS